MWHNSELISQTDRCAHLKSKFNLSDQLTLDAGSQLARGGQKLPKAPKAIQAGAVTGRLNFRVFTVSEAQSNVEGIARLETLASDCNPGSGIVESRRCADAQRVIGRC